MQKTLKILVQCVPIIVMIGLIPIVTNDYLLALMYIVIVALSLASKRTLHDIKIFILGFIVMIISEYVFTRTGVETFNRRTLFDLIPIWLPFLWGYGYVVIKRSIRILDGHNG